MSEFFELFQPGLKHWREQRDLEKVLVVTDEQGAPGPRPLDLESGTVTIELPVRPRPGSTDGPATVTG